MAAIENINSFLYPSETNSQRNLFIAASWKSFELYRSLEIPHEDYQKIFFVLHISSMAYCGERWNDLRRWYTGNND